MFLIILLAATYKSFSAVTAANDDDGGAITEKKRIIKLETQLAESLSYQNKEVSSNLEFSQV